jgi:hypothetical protein
MDDSHTLSGAPEPTEPIGPTDHLNTVEYWKGLYLDAIVVAKEMLDAERERRHDAEAEAQHWLERYKVRNREINALPRCDYALTTEMDDGPYVQHCTHYAHHRGDHRFDNYAERERADDPATGSGG